MSEKKPRLARILFFSFIGIIILAALWFYSFIFTHLITSVLFAYMLNPIIILLERHHVPRSIAISIVYIVIVGLLVLGLYYLAPVFVKQVTGVSEAIEQLLTQQDGQSMGLPAVAEFKDWIDSIHANYGLNLQPVMDDMDRYLRNLPDRITSFLFSLGSIFSFLITIPVIGFLLLKDQDRIKRYVLAWIPNRYFELIILLMEKIDFIIGTYLRALLIEILIVSALAAFTLNLLGVEYALIIGIIAGFANAIPYFGPFLGLLFASASVLLMGDSFQLILYVSGGMTMVQVIDNYFVYPFVMGKNTEMHPLVIMLTVIAAGYSFGIMGMFLSVPVVFLIRGIVQVLYKSLREFEII